MNLKNFFRDLRLVIKNAKELKNISPKPDRNTNLKHEIDLVFGDEFQAVNGVFGLKDYFKLALYFFFAYRLAKKKGLEGIHIVNSEENDPKDTSPDRINLFVNGILTGKEVGMANAEALSYLIGEQVVFLHNPTYGLIPDLAECLRGRTFNKPSKVAQEVADYIIECLKTCNEVNVFCHSQGAIIMNNALRIVGDVEKYNKSAKINVVTFGSGADEFCQPQGVYIENFLNERDFVARIGPLHFWNENKGEKFVSREKGHLLNSHYLEKILQGCYIKQEKSKFWNMIKRERLLR